MKALRNGIIIVCARTNLLHFRTAIIDNRACRNLIGTDTGWD